MFLFFVVISCFVVKDVSDFDSNGVLLKVVEIGSVSLHPHKNKKLKFILSVYFN